MAETDLPPWSPHVCCWGNNRSCVSRASGQLLTHSGPPPVGSGAENWPPSDLCSLANPSAFLLLVARAAFPVTSCLTTLQMVRGW